MRQILKNVQLWLRYQLGQSDLDLRLQELKGALDLGLQDIKREMAAQSAAHSADHVQILSTLGLLIADQKAVVQLVKERKIRRDPRANSGTDGDQLKDALELRLQEIRRDIAAQSADHVQTLSAFGLLIADQKAMLQLMKEREPQRDPLIALEARFNELQSAIEKQSADQKALLETAKDAMAGHAPMPLASHAKTSKDDYA